MSLNYEITVKRKKGRKKERGRETEREKAEWLPIPIIMLLLQIFTFIHSPFSYSTSQMLEKIINATFKILKCP